MSAGECLQRAQTIGVRKLTMTGVAELNQRANSKKTNPQARAQQYSLSRPISRPARVVIPIPTRPNTAQSALEKGRDFAARHSLFLLRLSLAIVFFWFGILKVANVSPVIGLLRGSIPFLASTPYLQILGITEIAIGAGLLVDRLAKQATTLMVVHLLCTLSLVVVAPRMIFAPEFPVLTMNGEFVLKNVVLITSALVIIFAAPVPQGRSRVVQPTNDRKVSGFFKSVRGAS